MLFLLNTTRWDSPSPSGICARVAAALGCAEGVTVSITDQVPTQCVAVDGEVIAFIDDYDAWDSLGGGSAYACFVEAIGPALILKQQLRRGAAYPPNTVSAGFLIPTHAAAVEPGAAAGRRPIDIVARMRVDEYDAHGEEASWMDARRTIVAQAAMMESFGYEVRWGRAPNDRYLRELNGARVGFNWEGFGRLTYRIIEYLRAGTVMITQPLGPEWPIRDDVTLEDGVSCIFCDRPEQFAREAALLLRDHHMLDRIRRNALEIWNEQLSLRAMGEWYKEIILRAADARRAGNNITARR